MSQVNTNMFSSKIYTKIKDFGKKRKKNNNRTLLISTKYYITYYKHHVTLIRKYFYINVFEMVVRWITT